MRIIYLGLAVPNLNNYHNMYTELMVEFRRQGHEVLIVGPCYDDEISGLQVEDDFQVIRVPTLKLFNVGKIQKGLANLLLPLQYKKALKKSGVNLQCDLIIMPTPPITLTGVAHWLKRRSKSKVYLILRDIFPQNAVDLKMMREGGIAYNLFRRMEKKMYRISDEIGCMSQANIDYVKAHNPEIEPKKLHLLPNWAEMMTAKATLDKNAIRDKYGIHNKFTVVFGGNIGRPQKMENIVALAKACEDIDDIEFLIFGGGSAKEALVQLVEEQSCNNLQLHDFLSREGFFEVLQCCDLGLISLSEDFTIPNFPSKATAYMNAGIPVLASVDSNTDFGLFLEEHHFGLWAAAGDTTTLRTKLLGLYNDRELCSQMGANGYNYMLENLQTRHAFETVVDKLQYLGINQ